MNTMIRTTIVLLLLFLPACVSEIRPQVYFSPGTETTAAIIQELSEAKEEVLVMAYGFTHTDIAKALLEAHKRGVMVCVVLDRSNSTAKYTEATFLANNGIPVYIDSQHPIMHSKVMVIDNRTLITGSFNFTKSAEKNAENTLILKSLELSREYIDNWKQHRDHSDKYSVQTDKTANPSENNTKRQQ